MRLTVVLLALATPASGFSASRAPAAVRVQCRSTAVLMALPSAVQEVVATRFKKAYPPSDVEALWKVLVQAYGSEAAATKAVQQNPTVLNPSYTNPPGLVSRSKAALVEVLGEAPRRSRSCSRIRPCCNAVRR